MTPNTLPHASSDEAFYPLASVSTDMFEMHDKFDIHDAVENLTIEQLNKFLDFRFDFLQEEIDEGRKAIAEKNPEEIVDSLVDLIVVAVGTLDLFGVNFDEAWYEVLRANMSKEVGINSNRKNELGLPDLIKPKEWQAPSHEGNHGFLPVLFEDIE